MYGIIPKPAVLIPADGQFVINKRTTVVVENEQFDGIAKNFVTQFKRATGYHLTIKDSSFNSSNSIIFKKIEGLPLEGYELSVTPKILSFRQVNLTASFTAYNLFFNYYHLKYMEIK